MKRTLPALAAAALAALMLAGCSTEPTNPEARADLRADSHTTIERFERMDPTLQTVLNRSFGYAVFPNVGKGGLIVGGSYGRGVVYQQGQMIGYSDITQATIGAQAGGASYSELLVFQTPDAMSRFRNNEFSFEANASAVAIESGAAANANFENGVAVFTTKQSGLMAEAALGGQRFRFTPNDNVSNENTYNYNNTDTGPHTTIHEETRTTTQNP